MAHGHEPQPIPKVEYKIVDPSVLVAPDVQNSQAAAYGFNDGKEWTGGENDVDGRYIRYLRESLSSFTSLYDDRSSSSTTRVVWSQLAEPSADSGRQGCGASGPRLGSRVCYSLASG